MEFGHLLWGSSLPVIVLTDNTSVTRFFQTKIIPPTLWNACDYVLQYNFVIAHIPGGDQHGSRLFIRVELNPVGKLEFAIRDDIRVQPIEVNIQSSGVAEEEEIYLDPNENLDESQIWSNKKSAREK